MVTDMRAAGAGHGGLEPAGRLDGGQHQGQQARLGRGREMRLEVAEAWGPVVERQGGLARHGTRMSQVVVAAKRG